MDCFKAVCTVTRIYGSWSSNGHYREMTLLDMIKWMRKNKYTMTARRENRYMMEMDFKKPGVTTEYIVHISKSGDNAKYFQRG